MAEAFSALKGLIIAAPKSGSGKTLITLALLRALKNRGLKTVSAKIGPDYIDPAFHHAASGQPCLNMDPWAMRTTSRIEVLQQLAKSEPDLLITEGVMGLFDGAKDGTGSSADIAAETGMPIILVVDVKGQSASAIATARGFMDFREDINIAAVIFNNVGSDSHRDLIAQAMAAHLDHIPVLGYLPRQANLEMPERHLGLVQAGEHQALDGFLESAAHWIETYCDLDVLSKIAGEVQIQKEDTQTHYIAPIGKHIAVARDLAFAFSYDSLLAYWASAGSTISFFSPLADEAPDLDADAIYLPGGYPELHAVQLSGNQTFLNGLRDAAKRDVFIFGECGGYMTLGRQIIDKGGVAHDMAGLLPLVTNFQKRKLHLGYRKVTLQKACKLGEAGQTFRAHEFHYASTDMVDEEAQTLFDARDAVDVPVGQLGLNVGSVYGSFIHLIDRATD